MSVYDVVTHRDQGACQRCGQRSGPMSRHHRKPRGMGGRSKSDALRPSNVVLLCGTGTTGCHGWVESHRGQAFGEGWLVHDWNDPVDVAVMTFNGPMWLTDRGTALATNPQREVSP